MQCGISVFEFWDLTISEINLIIKTFQKQEEDKAKEILSTNYNQACLISMFVLNGMNGKPNPSIQELYPNMFADSQPKEEVDENGLTEKDRLAAQAYMEQMLEFAERHNKKRHAAKEGE